MLGFHVKGTLLLSLGRAEAAASAFLQASRLKKDIYACKGLVDAYLSQNRFKEALGAAKEALADMPKNAKVRPPLPPSLPRSLPLWSPINRGKREQRGGQIEQREGQRRREAAISPLFLRIPPPLTSSSLLPSLPSFRLSRWWDGCLPICPRGERRPRERFNVP